VLRPTLDEVLANVIDSFDTIVAPDVTDEYALSISLTISNLLRHVRVRAAHEPEALWADNADLRALLADLGVDAPPVRPADEYPSLARLIDEAVALRTCLDTYVLAHPGDERVRAYLGRQLARQRPWMIEAWEGPRR
jgi:hypothetical protein